MGSKKSLNYLISKFAILELFFALFMSLFSYFLLNVLVSTGVVYPANYAEINSDTVKYEFLKENWKTDKKILVFAQRQDCDSLAGKLIKYHFFMNIN